MLSYINSGSEPIFFISSLFFVSVMLVVMFCVDLEKTLRDICEKQTRKLYVTIQ